jgi:hypothetical protein
VSASTIDRISENAQRTPANAYTLPEHYGLVVGAVYSEIGKGESIADLRRDLQRTITEALITQAGAPAGLINADAKVVANATLKRLKDRFDAELSNKRSSSNEITKLHLKEMSDSIGRFLSRSLTVSR